LLGMALGDNLSKSDSRQSTRQRSRIHA
jgi:hypothetical protein